MKKIIAIILFLWCSNAYASYTGTMPKDIGTSTPAGSENPNVIDDVLRERGTILYNVYKIKSVGTDTTLVANDSWVIASSTSGILLTMPAASSVANSSATKPFFIKNTNTGTVTLNITVDGVGSPTVSGSQTMCLFTDGTLWYEINAKNAYDSDYLGGVIASGYARAGANSDITSLSGMTTALPINEGGTGQTTAAAAATALGVGTGNSPTFAGVTATTGSITTLTSTTVNATNVSGTAGTFTGNLQIGSLSGLTDSSVPDNITLTNITQITNRSHTNLSDIGSNSHAAIDSHIASSSDPHGANLTQTNETITTGTVTTLYSTTGNITTGNITNLNTTSGTITTLNSTTGNIGNISGTAGTWTGNINAASASGFNYLSRWRSGSTIGTGTVAIQGSGDIIVTPTYSNANGTITISLSGSASAKPNVKYNATQIIGNTTDINFTSPLRVVGSGSTEAVISLDNISLGTQTNGSLAWNVINTGTPTDNTFFSTTPATNKVPYTGTSTNLNNWIDNTVIKIPATTTSQAAGAYGQLYVQSSIIDSLSQLLLHMDNPGTSTFVDSRGLHTITANGGAIGTTTAAFGSGGGYFDGVNYYLSLLDSEDWNFGGGNFTVDLRVKYTSYSGTQVLIGNWNSNDEGWMVFTIGTGLRFQYSTDGSTDITKDVLWSASPGVWYHVAVVRDNSNLYFFVDGTQVGTTQNVGSDVFYNSTNVLTIGMSGIPNAPFNGVMDEVRIVKGVAIWTTNFTPPISPYSASHVQYSTKYADPVKGNTVFEILTTGTDTAEPSYIYNNATTTVFGLGTNTAIVATSTVYSGWFNGAVRATAFNVASTEKIKENIKSIKIKPDLLDAESMAKMNYMANNKIAWIAKNGEKYTTAVSESGTGSVYHTDVDKMEEDYKNYIELEWASDLNQSEYIENIQKNYEKGFWQKFDAITPKSWNPKGVSNIVHKGFVVEDVPDEVKGDDKQSIDPMSLIAYMTKAQQALKSDTIFALKTLKELITTGTVTQQKIDYTNERLEVLESQ